MLRLYEGSPPRQVPSRAGVEVSSALAVVQAEGIAETAAVVGEAVAAEAVVVVAVEDAAVVNTLLECGG